MFYDVYQGTCSPLEGVCLWTYEKYQTFEKNWKYFIFVPYKFLTQASYFIHHWSHKDWSSHISIASCPLERIRAVFLFLLHVMKKSKAWLSQTLLGLCLLVHGLNMLTVSSSPLSLIKLWNTITSFYVAVRFSSCICFRMLHVSGFAACFFFCFVLLKTVRPDSFSHSVIIKYQPRNTMWGTRSMLSHICLLSLYVFMTVLWVIFENVTENKKACSCYLHCIVTPVEFLQPSGVMLSFGEHGSLCLSSEIHIIKIITRSKIINGKRMETV